MDDYLDTCNIKSDCPHCVEQSLKFAAQRRVEREYLKGLTTDLARGDGLWYLIDAVWMRKWHEWIYNKRRIPLVDQVGCQEYGYDEDVIGVKPPGPITNNRILKENTSVLSTRTNLIPRPGLEVAVHYRGVNKIVWDFLIEKHGGGPPICRKTLDLYA